MNRSNDPIRPNRRQTLGLFAATAAAIGVGALPHLAHAEQDDVLTEALVLRDPDIPPAGNANGDIWRAMRIGRASCRERVS